MAALLRHRRRRRWRRAASSISAADRRYAGVDIPATESLKTTLERVLPYWSSDIAPCWPRGETLLVAAHGNSLRAIVKHLFAVADEAIVGVEMPTGNPLRIDLDGDVAPRAPPPTSTPPPPRRCRPAAECRTTAPISPGRVALGAARRGTHRAAIPRSDASSSRATVIAEAATAEGGRPHAEEQALAIAGARARGATAYVSVEPCGERTSGAPSCAERLIAAGVARVVYALDNADARSAGRGPARLAAAGVTVERRIS